MKPFDLDFYELIDNEQIFRFSQTKFFINEEEAKYWVWEWLQTSNQWKNQSFRIDITPKKLTNTIYYYAEQ
jgi:hypothetical protein